RASGARVKLLVSPQEESYGKGRRSLSDAHHVTVDGGHGTRSPLGRGSRALARRPGTDCRAEARYPRARAALVRGVHRQCAEQPGGGRKTSGPRDVRTGGCHQLFELRAADRAHPRRRPLRRHHGLETVEPVSDAPSAGLVAGRTITRRFTNIWRNEAGTWRLFVRHANVLPAHTAR